MSGHVPGWMLAPTRLRFSEAMPSRSGTHAFRALNQHGPYDASQLELGDGAILFVFPGGEQRLARKLASALLGGIGTYRGFEKLFRVPVAMGQSLKSLSVDTDLADLRAAGEAYRDAIAAWNATPRDREPDVAIVLVPHSERFDTAAPYYAAKAAVANLGIPTQMATIEMLTDPNRFQWSVADIALAVFAKLGGIPWTVEAPAGDNDLIIGIGRADVGPDRRRTFGYAVTFVSNGIYRQTHSFTPTADEDQYRQRLQTAIEQALRSDLDVREPSRLVVHLSKRAGVREIEAAQHALSNVGTTVPTAFLRLDDSSLHDIADTAEETYAPPKGLVAKLGPRRALLQSEELTMVGPPDGPLLVEMDRRSTVPAEQFDELVAQAFRLSHANWRGFNARSKPATLVYGEQLAALVGHLQDVENWNPDLLRSELRNRPWFL